MMMLLSLKVGNFCSLFCNGLFQVVHSVALSWNLCVSFTLLSTKLCKDGMSSHFAFLTRAAILVALWPFTPLAPFAVNCCSTQSRIITNTCRSVSSFKFLLEMTWKYKFFKAWLLILFLTAWVSVAGGSLSFIPKAVCTVIDCWSFHFPAPLLWSYSTGGAAGWPLSPDRPDTWAGVFIKPVWKVPIHGTPLYCEPFLASTIRKKAM